MKIILFALCCLLVSLTNAQMLPRYFPVSPSVNYYHYTSEAPILPTVDGGYLLNYGFGNPNIHSGYWEGELIKTDANFIPQWRHHLFNDTGRRCFTYSDTTTIVVNAADHCYIHKFNASGQSIWDRGIRRPSGYNVNVADILDHHNNLLMAGSLSKYDPFGILEYAYPMLLEMDTAGTVVSVDSIVSAGYTYFSLGAAVGDAAGNIVFAGQRQQLGGPGSTVISKLDSNHAVTWAFTATTFYGVPTINAIDPLANGDMMVGGWAMNPFFGSPGMVLARLSSNGSVVWAKSIETKWQVQEFQELPSGDLLVMGMYQDSSGSIYAPTVIKLDANGNLHWAKYYASGSGIGKPLIRSSNDWIFPAMGKWPFLIETDNMGENANCPATSYTPVVATLPMTLTPESLQIYPHALDTLHSPPMIPQTIGYVDSCAGLVAVQPSLADAGIQVFPNPTTGAVRINAVTDMEYVEVHNALGQRVRGFVPESRDVRLDLPMAGLYFVSVKHSEGVVVRKVVVEQ